MAIITNRESPLFIAEISSNHNGDLDRCIEIINACADVGCDGVKFQLFKVNELFAPEAILHNPDIKKRTAWELKEEFIPVLSEETRKRGMLFSVTPFYLSVVEFLSEWVDFFKVASYELLWTDLFKACADTGKPIAFSTGMCTPDEIEGALEVLGGSKSKEIVVLHCNSAYPTPLSDVNLASISTLRDKYNNFLPGKQIEFGWSDHTVSDAVVLSSIFRHDSKMIEFHIDLDGTGFEFKAGHCWLPTHIGRVIRMVKDGRLSEGSGIIEPSASEIIERQWRADASDGLRPLLATREKLLKGEKI
jgi:N-acetylneuraminate synthase